MDGENEGVGSENEGVDNEVLPPEKKDIAYVILSPSAKMIEEPIGAPCTGST